jgi:hypothetical protein
MCDLQARPAVAKTMRYGALSDAQMSVGLHFKEGSPDLDGHDPQTQSEATPVPKSEKLSCIS